MDLAISTRAAENRTRWKVIVANPSVVPRRPSKVMGYYRIEIYVEPVLNAFNQFQVNGVFIEH